jgi:glycosyltransferase involved in cell wall biosynthesis
MTQPHTPRLSIGLPVYNGEGFLAQAIDSLLGQTFTDFHLLIADNASTDRTESICRSYAERDPRIRYHRAARNRGLAWNFNRLVGLAEGDYFKWATHDDLCAPELVARCIEVLDRDRGVVLCYTKSQIIDGQGNVVSPYDNRIDGTHQSAFDRFRDVLTNLFWCHMQFGVIRLDVLRRTGLHGAYPTSDRVLLGELALHGRFYEVDAPLFSRRDHTGRAARASNSDAELAALFDSSHSAAYRSLRWTRFKNHLRSIARAPLPLDEKLQCAWWLLERRLRSWHILPPESDSTARAA